MNSWFTDLINSMRENNQLSERRTKISLVTDLHCIHKVDSMECVVAGPLLLQCESSVQGRKKKKKKKQKPRKIVEVNSPSLLDKEKISVKECGMKNGDCSTTVEGNSHDSESAEGSENSQDSDEHSEQKNRSLESTSPVRAFRSPLVSSSLQILFHCVIILSNAPGQPPLVRRG